MKKKKSFTDKQICWFLYGITFLMMVILSSPLSISYILDETGTVANAAYLAGYNWNDWVNSTGGYFYKYGQAIFYFPLLKLFSNPYLIYKLMLIVNGAFFAVVPVISYKILRKHLKEEDKVKCTLVSLCLAVIPATILYSLFARADVLLIAFSWIACYVLLENMDADTKRKQILLSSLLAFLAVYLYMCHSRGVVFVIAISMVVLAVRFVMKEKGICLWAYFVNLLLWMFVDDRLTKFFKNSIWGSKTTRNGVDAVSADKFKGIFTAEGFEALFKNTTGWLFNSFLGTFGLVTLGVFFAAVILVYFISKKKDISKKEAVISLYALLVYFGTIAMSVLFFFKVTYKFVTGVSVKRADRFLYSRYMTPIYGILVFIALYYLVIKKDCFGWKTKIAALLSGGVLIVYCRTWLADFVNRIEYSWRNTIDSAMFFDTDGYGNDANEFVGVSRALLLAAVLAFCVLLLCIILSQLKLKQNQLIVVLVAGCFLFSTAVNYKKLRFATDVRPMMSAGPVITEMYKIEKDTGISEKYGEVYVDESVTRDKMYQLAMPKFIVHVNKSMEAKDVENMFILAKNYTLNEEWAGEDCYLLEGYDLENTYTTILVKGNDLKKELESKGIRLTTIPKDYTAHEKPKRPLWLSKDMRVVFRYQLEAFSHSK